VRWLASLLLLAGCASDHKLPEVVRVPVAVPCIERIPEEPETARDADLLALDDYRLVLTLARDRAALAASYGELRALAEACVR
jgi:hypothetical protein